MEDPVWDDIFGAVPEDLQGQLEYFQEHGEIYFPAK